MGMYFYRGLAPLLLFALPGLAHANAFPLAAGTGRIITTVVVSNSDKGFDDRGGVIDIPDYDQLNIYVQGEYGATDDLTLIVSPSYRDIDVEGPGRDTSGINFVELGGRYAFARSGAAVFSVQATARIAGQTFRDPLAQVSQLGTEYDLRGTVGAGFGPDGGAGFISAEAGYRFRGHDQPDEFHADLTLGYHAAPRLLLLASSYNTISNGAGRNGFSDYRYHSLYLGGVYDVSDRVAVQLGVQGTVAGENALRERGFFAGLWFKF